MCAHEDDLGAWACGGMCLSVTDDVKDAWKHHSFALATRGVDG
jgi:hypothetical protein